MKVLWVTGADGYIGRRLVGAAAASGWEVVAATRRPAHAARAWTPYRLEEAPDAEAIPWGACVVHLAARTSASADDGLELRAAQALCQAVRKRNGSLLFVSSQTARPDAPTAYGRTKWAIEQVVLQDGRAIVVRPGLVYGGRPGGLYATLLRSLARYPVMPVPAPAPLVQPVHIDDLVAVLLSLAAAPPRQPLWRVGTAPVGFDHFLVALARSRGRSPPRMLRVPRALLVAAAACLPVVGAGALAARMRSLMELPPTVADDVGAIGVSLRPLEDGTRPRRAARAQLVVEATTLLAYVLGARPNHRIVRRYVRAVEAAANPAPLSMPNWVHRLPCALRILDQPAARRSDPLLAARIDAAVAIAEADPQGASVFLHLAPSRSPFATVLRLGRAGIVEAAAMSAGAAVRLSRRFLRALRPHRFPPGDG